MARAAVRAFPPSERPSLGSDVLGFLDESEQRRGTVAMLDAVSLLTLAGRLWLRIALAKVPATVAYLLGAALIWSGLHSVGAGFIGSWLVLGVFVAWLSSRWSRRNRLVLAALTGLAPLVWVAFVLVIDD